MYGWTQLNTTSISQMMIRDFPQKSRRDETLGRDCKLLPFTALSAILGGGQDCPWHSWRRYLEMSMEYQAMSE